MSADQQTPPPAAESSKKSQPYRVWDLNQRGEKPRVHDIIVKMYPPKDNREPDILSYALFASGEGLPMPHEHALKFLGDKAFKVVSPAGNRLMPIERFDLSKPITKLATNEVIAKYENLSRDYLFATVKMTPGSEEIKHNATVQELAEFMVKWRESLVAMTESDRRVAEMMASGELGGAMDEASLDKLLGERKAA